MIFVNFKTYPHGSGKDAVKLAIICEVVAKKTGVSVIPIVQALDLYRIKKTVNIPIWIQHVDPYEQGQHTGYTSLENALEMGASGTLLNHSEHRIDPHDISRIIKRAEKIKHSFLCMVCVSELSMIDQLSTYNPDYIAYEPPEYIGSLSESVATKDADSITHARKVLKPSIPLIIGAGIKSKNDCIVARKRGAKGILVATAIVKSSDPEFVLTEFASVFS